MNPRWHLRIGWFVAAGWVVGHLFFSPLSQAQVVNDGATATLNHVTNTISGGITVGTNGPFTLLILTNGTLLTNSGNGTIGLNAGANSNTVKVTSGNTRWAMSSDLSVGSVGSFNRLVITNGGLVQNGFGALGIDPASRSNLAVITGAGSVWTNQNDLYVGYVGRGNSLVVSNGGFVADTSGILGVDALSSNNLTTVTDSGSHWSNRASLFVGFSGSRNTLVVSNSASAFASNNVIVGLNSGAVSNFLLLSGGAFLTNKNYGALGVNSGANANTAFLSGSNTVWGLGQSLFVGSNGAMNRLVVSNGAQISGRSGGNIGNSVGATNNSAVITDGGSAWRIFADFGLGSAGAGNLLVITNGGLLVNGDGEIGGGPSASNNQAFVIGTNSVWTNRQDLNMGISGAGNQLTVEGGGLLENFTASIGNFVSGSNNQATVTGAGSVWNNRGELNVGYGGSGNQITVAKSGTVFASNSIFLGFLATSSNNYLHLYGGILRTTNATGTASLDIRRGTNQFDFGTIEADRLLMTNRAGFFEFNGGLLITRGAIISNGVPFVVGKAGSTPAIWDVRAGPIDHSLAFGDLVIGSNAGLNQLLITNGALLSGGGSGFIGGTGANSNLVLLSGGSRWVLGTDLIIGRGGASNRVIISDGALVRSEATIIGTSATSSNNEVVVTGAGSLWSNSITVLMGSLSPGNRLIVSNGAMAWANSFIVGFTNTSLNNRIIVDGGMLIATNAGSSGLLDVRRGTNVLNSGLIEVDRLLVTNMPSYFEFNGGTLITKSTTNNIGRAFSIGNGVRAATLSLAGNGVHNFFAAGLIIRSNASLIGNGTIHAPVTVENGGTLAPGASIGKLMLVNSIILQGSTIMEISKTGSTLTNDQLQVIGPVTFGGTLLVTNIGPTALGPGDQFQIFNAGGYVNSFANIILPPLGPGLIWTNKLSVDGSIQVLAGSAPHIDSVRISGTNFVISCTGGPPNTNYVVVTTTNVALPLTNWISVLTNSFDSGGNFILSNAISAGIPQRFYRLLVP